MGTEAVLAIGTLIGALGGLIVKYVIDRRTVTLNEHDLLEKKRATFHQEVIGQLEREQRAKDACHAREQELRLLLWRAIGKAEEATGEAESNTLHFLREGE